MQSMNKQNIGTEEVLYRLGLVAALVAVTIFLAGKYADENARWTYISAMTGGPGELRQWLERYSFCVIYRFTGFTCPGCGGTRALSALFHGRVLLSFLYHPLVLYGSILYIAFMSSHTLAKIFPGFSIRGMKWKNAYLIIAIALLIGNVVIKNMIYLLTGIDVLAALDCF